MGLDLQAVEVAAIAPFQAVREQRRHPRHAFGVVTYLQLDGTAGQVSAFVGDLSLGGLFLKVQAGPVDLQSRVRLVLELPFFASHRICTLTGRVVRVAAQAGDVLGLGIEFEEGQEHDRQLLADFLALWGAPGA